MDTERFLATAGELLAMPSTAERPGELNRALGFVLDFVGPGFTVERFESGGKPSALLYRGARRRHFPVILNAHLDVVPAPPAQFRPRREGGRLYARGAQDMKVSALVEAQAFRELAGGLPYPLALQLVTDEEVGGRDGTLHQIGQGVSGEFVVIGEHSGLRIVTDSKGMVTATLRAVGRSGHSAYPWQGDNALVKLERSLARLLATYPVATEEAWRTTVNLARIETPNRAWNQIPALAGGVDRHPLPARRHRPERQDRPGDHRLPGGVLRAGRHAGGQPRLTRRTTPTGAARRSTASSKPCATRVTTPISCASTVPRTGVSTTSRARTPSSSASAATGCTGPTSTPTWPPSPPYYRALREFLLDPRLQ
jgi:hypothetical protein